MSAQTILPGRGMLLSLRSNVWWMPAGGQLREVRAAMCKMWRMPAGRQLRELRTTMRRLLWKMLRVLMPQRFCLPIGSSKRVTRFVKLTKASESNCRKSVAKKFETLTVKHAVPNVNWIMQTKVGTK